MSFYKSEKFRGQILGVFFNQNNGIYQMKSDIGSKKLH